MSAAAAFATPAEAAAVHPSPWLRRVVSPCAWEHEGGSVAVAPTSGARGAIDAIGLHQPDGDAKDPTHENKLPLISLAWVVSGCGVRV